MSKILVYIYTTEKRMNPFEIVYLMNPVPHVNKVFIKQVEQCLRAKFHQNTMESIKSVMRKEDTCIIALIMFYNIKTKNPIKVYRVLSCVRYSFIENYV